MKDKTAPPNITRLEPNQIFVFGSNTEGRHGEGAARFGAIYGQSQGRQGQSYAICTNNLKNPDGFYPIFRISNQVGHFLVYAKDNPDLEFFCTPFGTGLAGRSHEEMAHTFLINWLTLKDVGSLTKSEIVAKYIPENIYLPEPWVEYLISG